MKIKIVEVWNISIRCQR